MYNTILYMIKRQGFERDLFQFFAFSDCMYIITDKENIQELLLALSLLSYYMLFDNSTKNYAGISNQYVGIEKVEDCYKVRGGVTFGKVLSVPQNNVVLGKGVIEAYALEVRRQCIQELYLMITVAESLTYLIVIPLSKMQTEVSMKQNHEFINFRLLVFVMHKCVTVTHNLKIANTSV